MIRRAVQPLINYSCYLSLYLPTDIAPRVWSPSESSEVEHQTLSDDRKHGIRDPSVHEDASEKEKKKGEAKGCILFWGAHIVGIAFLGSFVNECMRQRGIDDHGQSAVDPLPDGRWT